MLVVQPALGVREQLACILNAGSQHCSGDRIPLVVVDVALFAQAIKDEVALRRGQQLSD